MSIGLFVHYIGLGKVRIIFFCIFVSIVSLNAPIATKVAAEMFKYIVASMANS